MNENSNFKDILIPIKDSVILGTCSSSRIKKKSKLICQYRKGETPALYGQELLPRTFIFVKADYKFSSVQIYIYNLHLIVRPTFKSKNEMGLHITRGQLAMGRSAHQKGGQRTHKATKTRIPIPTKPGGKKFKGQNKTHQD